MALKKRYINAAYANPRGGGDNPGNHMWIKATVKRGKKQNPPTVTWYANRAQNDNDELYIEDPVFHVPGGQDAADVRWARVELPDVTGARWSFELIRAKQGKPNKTIRVPDQYETWKRIFLDVHADDDGLLDMFKRALPLIQRAFAPACIEVVQNRLMVANAYKRGHGTDKSRAQGRAQGEVYSLKMEHPQVDPITKTLTFWVDNGVTNCRPVTVHGNDLHLTLAASGTWDLAEWLRSIKITDHTGQVLVDIAYYGRSDGVEVDRAVVATAMRGTVSQRISNQVVHFKLDAAPLANAYDKGARTWSTPRATTVQQALLAGRVTFELGMRWEVTGGTGGLQVNAGHFTTYIDRGVNALAAVLAHEFGHACGLVKAQSLQRHAAGLHRHDSATPPRVPINAGVANPRYYNADYGGSGTHCNLGATQVPSCITVSGDTYEPQPPAYLCIMYHASTTKDDDTVLTDNISFCDQCVRQLRGR